MIGDNALGIGLALIMFGVALLGMIFFGIKWLIESAYDLPRKRKHRDWLDYNDTWEP